MRRICTALAAAAALTKPAPITAQPYPSKPVKIIVGFAPGGGNDIVARFIAHQLSSSMGQQFIVDNKPGAGGSIAYSAGINSPPDGYTLTLISIGYAVNPSLYRVKFDPVNDITPITQIAQGALVIVVNPSLPAETLQDLIALAKSQPGKLNYASGAGTNSHLATELFASMAAIKLNHIPYKGAAPALTDTIAGQTDLTFAAFAAALPHVKTGRLRALAVTTPKRQPTLPDTPTVAESGVPGNEAVQWYALIGPKGLPAPIVARINSEVSKLLELKETARHLQDDGMSPAGGTPEQLLALIKREVQTWQKVVTDLGIRIQ
jgi:tripartite-type tricarboxylate transporter receptor subunit TctC